MEAEANKIKRTSNFASLKLLILITMAIILLIGSVVGLRSVCTPAKASEKQYILISTPTVLYRNNDFSEPLLTLPTAYHAELLSSTGELYRVRYNGETGFIRLSSPPLIEIEITEPAHQTAEIKTKSDAGTHLRVKASATSEKIVVIPANSDIEYIGELSGDIPSDGTSPIWYLVRYDSGATTTHTGYVYSERVTIISGKLERPIEKPTASTSPSTNDIQSTTTEGNTDTESKQTQPISSGLKIFLIILFSVLAIIIFGLLLISPKGKRATEPASRFSDISNVGRGLAPAENVGRGLGSSAETSISKKHQRQQAEFGEFVEFSQPVEKRHSKGRQNPTRLFTRNTHSNELPSALSKYFKIERTAPFDPNDDEDL